MVVRIAVRISLSVCLNRSSSSARVSLMSPSVVLIAEQLGNNGAPAALAKGEGCIRPSAPRVAKIAKCRSSHATGDQCIVRIATLLLDDNDREESEWLIST